MYSLSRQKRMALVYPLMSLLGSEETMTIEEVNDNDPGGWPFSGWSVRINGRPTVFTFNGNRCQVDFEDTLETIEFDYALTSWFSHNDNMTIQRHQHCSAEVWDTGTSSVLVAMDCGEFETESKIFNINFRPSEIKTKFKVEIAREMVDFDKMVWPENACLGNATLHIFLARNLMRGTWDVGTAIQLTDVHRISGENREVATYTTQYGKMRIVIQPRSDSWKMSIALNDQRGKYMIYRNPINDCLEFYNEIRPDESLQLNFTDAKSVQVECQGIDLGRYFVGRYNNMITAIRTH